MKINRGDVIVIKRREMAYDRYLVLNPMPDEHDRIAVFNIDDMTVLNKAIHESALDQYENLGPIGLLIK